MYTGLYLIINKIGPVNYVIQRLPTTYKLTVHLDKLKLMHGDTPTSWLSEPLASTAVSDHAPIATNQQHKSAPTSIDDRLLDIDGDLMMDAPPPVRPRGTTWRWARPTTSTL